MATRRAEVVALKDLSKAVDRAIALASKRHRIKLEKPSLSLKWEIIGRMLREQQDMNVAFGVATDISESVKLRGIDAQPTCVKLGRDILVGFIERGMLPRAF